MREHVKPSVRMHYVYKRWWSKCNSDLASVWLWIRDSKSGVAEVTERMFNVAKGAALMAGVEYDIKLNNGLYEILTNEGAKVLQKNMNLVGPIVYTREK
jgi:aminobenzoyl-glutamate utilization protein B